MMRESVKKKPQNSLPKRRSFPSAQAASRQLWSSLTGPCCEASVRKAAAPRASRAMLTFVGLQGTGCSAAGLEKQTPVPLHGRFLWSRGSQAVTNPSCVAQRCLCCLQSQVVRIQPPQSTAPAGFTPHWAAPFHLLGHKAFKKGIVALCDLPFAKGAHLSHNKETSESPCRSASSLRRL